MSLDWASEHYVRLFTKETEEDLLLSWEARALWHELLKRFDKHGFIKARQGARTIAALIRYPVEVVERCLPELLNDGRIEQLTDGLCAPNYKSANSTPRSSAARQADHRWRVQNVRGTEDSIVSEKPRDTALPDVTESHDESRAVTSSNEMSRAVTQIRSDQINSDQCRSDGRAHARGNGTSFQNRFQNRISENWAPKASEISLAQKLGLDPYAEAREFKAFWIGEGKPKEDWDATFRARLEAQASRKRAINGAGVAASVTMTPPKFSAPEPRLPEDERAECARMAAEVVASLSFNPAAPPPVRIKLDRERFDEDDPLSAMFSDEESK